MAEMTFRDRLKIAALSAERSQRSAIAQTLATWLPAWSVAPHPVDRLLIVPQDLRTADPSFWREIEHGQFGLAGSIAFLHGRSPFDIAPPTAAWERELHSFGWLRNLAAATDDDEARRGARLLASEWAIRFGGSKGVAAEPVVAARRLISWVSHATLLLEGADAATYEAITMSLGRQIALLASSRRDAPDGYPRLLTLIALMFAELSVAGQKRKLKDVEPTLVAELRRQILPDGGHMSRNPDVLVELLLDLLPLNQCFAARNRESPPQLVEVLARLLAMLRFLRLGDGMLARFNGVGAAAAAGLGTIVAYGDSAAALPSEARASGYARLARGTSIVVVDVGSPPALAVGGDAQAGCLSFEMSAGRHLLFVNGGMPAVRPPIGVPPRAPPPTTTRCVLRSSPPPSSWRSSVCGAPGWRCDSPTTSTGISRMSMAASRWKRATMATSAALGCCTGGTCSSRRTGCALRVVTVCTAASATSASNRMCRSPSISTCTPMSPAGCEPTRTMPSCRCPVASAGGSPLTAPRLPSRRAPISPAAPGRARRCRSCCVAPLSATARSSGRSSACARSRRRDG